MGQTNRKPEGKEPIQVARTGLPLGSQNGVAGQQNILMPAAHQAQARVTCRGQTLFPQFTVGMLEAATLDLQDEFWKA